MARRRLRLRLRPEPLSELGTTESYGDRVKHDYKVVNLRPDRRLNPPADFHAHALQVGGAHSLTGMRRRRVAGRTSRHCRCPG